MHPGVQHSRELVRALHEGGLLSRFVTSFNGGAGSLAWLPGGLGTKLRARVVEGVPEASVVTIPYVEAVTSVLSPVLDARLRLRLVYAGIALFDRLAAGPATRCRPRIVVGFENGCLQLFRSAKRFDALCVLDAASVHHAAQPGRANERDTAFWQRVNVRKDEEIALADHIVVLSEYARSTYVAAGVSPEKISIVPPGVSA